jgi:hypothetical protein
MVKYYCNQCEFRTIRKNKYLEHSMNNHLNDDEKNIKKIKDRNLTYLSILELFNLKDNILKTYDIEGDIVETGCGLGGSSICMSLFKNPDKKLKIYDVFGTIPEPSKNDGNDVHERYLEIKKGNAKGINGDKYYGYKKNLLDEIKKSFKSFDIDINKSNIVFIKGLYEETLKIDNNISFAHIDCDWYESVKTSLTQIVPNLSKGGIITLDDYNAWSGCKLATDEYFKDIKKKFIFEKKNNKLNITKI